MVNDTFPNRIYPSHQNVVTTLVKQGWSASDIVAGRMSQTFTTDSKEFFHILYCALLLQHHPQSIPIIKQSPDFNEPNDHLQTKLQELLMNVHLNTLLLLYRNVEMVWNHTRKVQIAVIELYESALVRPKKQEVNIRSLTVLYIALFSEFLCYLWIKKQTR